MTDKRHKWNYAIKARAVFLLLIAFYTYVLMPVVAANPAGSDRATADSGSNKAPSATPLRANPPLRLLPPPPAEAPAAELLQPPARSPFADTTPSSSSENAFPAPVPLPGIDSSYILGPGDQLLVSDYSSSETTQPILSPAAPILPDGTIDIHPLGVIKVAGLTLRELTELVNRRSAQFIIKPDIGISVIKVRPNMVYILGEVIKPGLFTNESSSLLGAENVVSSSANLTLVSALQKAGGIKESADVRNIRITRLGATEPIRSNLWQLLVDGDASQDIGLMSGDVIFVPKGGADYDADALGLSANQRRRVRIWGAVRAPGLLDMEPTDDVLSVISKAGGFTTTATRKWVLLSRMNRDGTVTTQKINMSRGIRDPDAVARTHVKPGDLILVHDSLLKRGGAIAFQGGVYFLYAVGLITYGVFLSNAVTQQQNQNGGSSSSSGTTIPVIAPTTTTGP